jgi:hypothetical protein
MSKKGYVMNLDNMMEELRKYLENSIDLLSGDFVRKNNGYDEMICNILDKLSVNTSRYWDACWLDKNIYIEFKKGKSIWLDLVRYSEIKKKVNADARIETITLFFIPDVERTRIIHILGLKTSKLIEKLNISDEDADFIIKLNKIVPRSLNAQASLTVNDIKEICDFKITKNT